MILGLGTDIIRIERVKTFMRVDGVSRIFTKHEQEYCDSKAEPGQHYAGMWAAKEALTKCVGVKIPHLQMEITHNIGRPYINFVDVSALPVAVRVGFQELYYRTHVSISHEGEYAMATVILED